jgi:hypothetical protein
MLTRALLVLVLLGGSLLLSLAARAETKLLALGLADHAVTEAELADGKAPPVPRFNTPGVAYVLMGDVKKGDTVEVRLNLDGKPLLRNTETADADKPSLLLQAGKGGVPAGGWPEGSYTAEVKVSRDGKPVLEKTSEPVLFE